MAPAQRAEVILDLSRHAMGSTIGLETAAYPASEVGMTEDGMAGMGRPAAVPNGTPRTLMTLRVTRKATDRWVLPSTLGAFDARWSRTVAGPVRRVELNFRRMQWTLAGRTFELTGVQPEETVAASSAQVWEIANVGGMMGMPMAHPIHIHGPQFRVLSRTSGAPGRPLPGSIREGLVDAGWQDTILVLPDETVRLQLGFTDYPGLYLYHCHILEHEDAGMMRNFKVS
jgi:FtsP/CotA-like multicopper oxidase with cupredoxin domain